MDKYEKMEKARSFLPLYKIADENYKNKLKQKTFDALKENAEKKYEKMIFKTPTVYSGDINDSLNVNDEPSLADQVVNLENVYKDDEPFIEDNPSSKTSSKMHTRSQSQPKPQTPETMFKSPTVYTGDINEALNVQDKDIEEKHTKSKTIRKTQTPDNLKVARSQNIKKKSSNK